MTRVRALPRLSGDRVPRVQRTRIQVRKSSMKRSISILSSAAAVAAAAAAASADLTFWASCAALQNNVASQSAFTMSFLGINAGNIQGGGADPTTNSFWDPAVTIFGGLPP